MPNSKSQAATKKNSIISVPIAAPKRVNSPRIRLTPMPSWPNGTRKLMTRMAESLSDSPTQKSWVGL